MPRSTALVVADLTPSPTLSPSTPSSEPSTPDLVASVRAGSEAPRPAVTEPSPNAAAFGARLAAAESDLRQALQLVYGSTCDVSALIDEVVAVAARHAAERKPALVALDAARELDEQWFQRPSMIGYVAYADRFAGDLRGVRDQLDYLSELGVTYLHLMPLLEPRPGENDGGYAVSDYRAVDPRLGSMADLSTLADALRERQMSLCIDLVVNHTAREHQWAQRALGGDEHYRRFYHAYPDRRQPDRYEQTLREVFPEWAPGNFTWVAEMNAWLWTTFQSFQWDLDYANPNVFVAIVDILLYLANQGVEVFRLDAVPFMWKRIGTSCENLPEVHQLLRALRAVARVAAPAIVFKAEAIVPPDDLVQYLGAGVPERRECDLAYNNQLMVMLWSSLATRDAVLMTNSLARMTPKPATTTWVTYVRCHDDIGWAVTDTDAASMGWSGAGHRRFLSDFYAGSFDGSFARGELFQVNPATNDSRISGTAASLAGIEDAVTTGDADRLAAAIDRVVLVYSIAFSFGGIPLVYMGDEIALLNDGDFAAEPGHENDNRWIHRPRMDWLAAARRTVSGTVESTMFARLAALARARASIDRLDGRAPTYLVDLDDPVLFCYRRGGDGFLAVCNFAETPRTVALGGVGNAANYRLPLNSGGAMLTAGSLRLPPLGFAWITE